MQPRHLLLLLSLVSAFALQDPKPSEKPAAPAERVVGKPKPHVYEGVYRLTGRVMNGVRDSKPSKGYLAITNRHLFLNLAAARPDKEHPSERWGAGVATDGGWGADHGAARLVSTRRHASSKTASKKRGSSGPSWAASA